MTDKKIVMRCNHCENTARFLLIDSYLHKEYEWVKNFGNAVWNITWKFLECQTCSHPTLVQSTILCEIFDLVNFIVRETITRPREIKKIYNSLPESKRTEIDARQKKKENPHDIGISPEYYALIVSGEKTVEIRVASKSMKLIKVGHIVRFNKKLESDCQVVRIAQYNTFAEMIEQEDPRKINPRVDAETQLAAIRRIYNAEKELLGVLVFELKKV